MSTTRSSLALGRLVGAPYGALLALYLALLGGGGAWLHRELRAAEAELEVERLLGTLGTVAERFAAPGAADAARGPDPAALAEVGTLFDELVELEAVSLRDAAGGWIAEGPVASGTGALPRVRAIPGEDVGPAPGEPAPAERLADGSDDPLFLLRFELEGGADGPARLDFALRREALLARIDGALAGPRRALAGLALGGTAGIALAALIAVRAMRTTRRLESHFQSVHRRAAFAETAAELVHDLRTPLGAIRANVAALGLGTDEREEVLDELDRDVVALDAKLDAFLGLARRRAAAPEPTDLAALVAEAVRLAEPVLARHGLGVELELGPELPRIALDAAGLRDALVNLIVNAAQSGQRAGAVRVGARADGAALELWVEDDGEGVDEADLPRLLEPFHGRRPQGSGLGLASARRAAEAHGGRVRVENRPGGGARAALVLPRTRSETPRWWTRLQRPSPT